MEDDQQFCLRWNNHQSTLVSVFDTLLEKGIHVDCTLAAEGQTLKAHKVVLSACSPYFESVLSQNYDKHPIIILKDVKYAELRAMMDYMYRGEVNISQDQLAALLKAAESLQIKGLSDNKPSRPPSRPAAAAPAAPAPPPHVPLPPHPAHPAHPPRAVDPQPQVRDGSIDSREGSVSPTRRRKKARRLSTETITPIPPPNDNAQGNGEEQTQCKEEIARDGMEDLTIDEDNDDQPPVTHNDVVRNFQWHMERSQDEMINSNDSVRESQGPSSARNIVTRSTNVIDESDRATTFAILKPANKLAKKENKTGEIKMLDKPVEVPVEGTKKPVEKVEKKEEKRSESPESGGSPPPLRRRSKTACAQYKTEKGYKCPNCQRCYNARKNLVRHITLECGREPQYKCPVCHYSKHRRNELNNHIKRKHPDHQLAQRLAKVK